MIGFPGFGLEFEIRPTFFKEALWGWFNPAWYGLIIAVGFLAAVMYCLRISKRFGILQDDVIDMLFFVIPAGIIGARFVYVIFSWDQFSGNLASVFYIGNGGLAIYGAILFASAAAALFCRMRRINAGAMLDLGAFGFLIGQAVGRWGNFTNMEVFGTETALPWRMTVYGADVHPLFLYESLWNIAGFVLLRLLLGKRKYNGQLFTLYIAWYGLGRGMLEGLRNPGYQLMVGDVPAMMVAAFATLMIALTLLIVMTAVVKREKEDLTAWTADREAYMAEKKAKKSQSGKVTTGIVGEDGGEDAGAEEDAGNGAADGAEGNDDDGPEDQDGDPDSQEDQPELFDEAEEPDSEEG